MSILDLLDKITLAGVATTVALVLSVITFVRQEVGKRAATPVVTFERIAGDKSARNFIVVHNHGPALAREVTARFLSDSDDPEATTKGVRVFDAGPLDIPPGHAARMEFVRFLGHTTSAVELTWRDRRRGVHSLEVPVNIVELPGAPIVNVTVGQPPNPGTGGARRQRY